MRFRFLHAADLHLDSPLRGLDRYEGAPSTEIRVATRQALTNLVVLAIDEKVQFLVLAGDVFDGDSSDYGAALFFSHQMSRLGKAGIEVFAIRGNHDAESRMTKGLVLPANVHLLSAARPETREIESLGVAIHGQSFPKPVVTNDLAATYPAARPGRFNLGILHTSVDGRPGHEPYAPTSLDTLRQRGYDYWALGHVHERAVLDEDPWVVFSGCTQGRHIRETGAKGATLVDVEDGVIVDVTAHPLDVLRWARVELLAGREETPDAVLSRFEAGLADEIERADGRLLAARVIVRGATEAHREFTREPQRWQGQFRARATELGAELVWLEKVELRTESPVPAEDEEAGEAALGALLREARALDADDGALVALATAELESLRSKLPAIVLSDEDALDLSSAESLRPRLHDARDWLHAQLRPSSDPETAT